MHDSIGSAPNPLTISLLQQQPVSARLEKIETVAPEVLPLVERLLAVATRGLPEMYAPLDQMFAFRCRLQGARPVLVEGASMRYSAMVLLGAQSLAPDDQRRILHGELASEFCERLLGEGADVINLGDTALLVWAAAELGLPGLEPALDHLHTLVVRSATPFTVEWAWALSALTAAYQRHDTRRAACVVAERLLGCFNAQTGLFAHWIEPAKAPWYRRHAACFADQVYPLQALARFHETFANAAALDAAAACAARLVELQGEAGQWWWQYDHRTGRVLEGYPVYTVHQDSMAPMALFDLERAGGPDHSTAIARGLRWFLCRPELPSVDLVRDNLALVWRSIRRGDPSKAVRRLRALATCAHPSLRLRILEVLFPPRVIDFEDRPYHLGWILYAWLTR